MGNRSLLHGSRSCTLLIGWGIDWLVSISIFDGK